MHAGEIAAVTAAGAFVVLVLLLAIPLVKLGRTLDEATLAIRSASAQATPLLQHAQSAIALAETQLNTFPAAVEPNRSSLPASRRRPLGSLVRLSIGAPLLRVLAVSYGIRSTVLRPADESVAEQAAIPADPAQP